MRLPTCRCLRPTVAGERSIPADKTPEEAEELRQAQRTRTLRNVKFIGELYKRVRVSWLRFVQPVRLLPPLASAVSDLDSGSPCASLLRRCRFCLPARYAHCLTSTDLYSFVAA